ncbi:STAS domain-containing protein [Jannaschia pohangensis]|uniref:STAS domain-containing protein n=1 Tax=Jannaschia pohangensis TaxID=390807 RepID=A0A1I3H431_9RHOB|nr:STAS domain-containing protein [Jannaschia pohangensis]SFI30441.1 STAS domain-containing protein [Jannaschia pohangensis]
MTDKPEDAVIVLPKRLEMTTANALRDEVLAIEGDLVLDASGVTVVTTPGVQVLMAIRDHQALRGRHVRVDRPTGDFMSCIAILGAPLSRLQTEGVTA